MDQQHLKASALYRNEVHLRQYWKNESQLIKSNRIKYWMSYVQRNLQNQIKRTTANITSMIEILPVLRIFSLFRISSYEEVTGDRLIFIAVGYLHKVSVSQEVKLYHYMITPHKNFNMNLTFIEFKLIGALQCLSKKSMLEYLNVV